MTKENKETQILKDLFTGMDNGFIPMPRKLARVLGLNVTTLLVELCDKQDYYKSAKQLNDHGEFYYTVATCEINTGLTRREQSTAITKLKDYGFVERIISRGMPKIRYFKMSDDIPKLLAKLCAESEEKKFKILGINKAELDRFNSPATP